MAWQLWGEWSRKEEERPLRPLSGFRWGGGGWDWGGGGGEGGGAVGVWGGGGGLGRGGGGVGMGRINKFGKPFSWDADSTSSLMECQQLGESRMSPMFFTSFPLHIWMVWAWDPWKDLLKSKQAPSVSGNNHKETCKTRGLGNHLLYFSPDWEGCDLFLFIDEHFRKAFLLTKKLLQAMNKSFSF